MLDKDQNIEFEVEVVEVKQKSEVQKAEWILEQGGMDIDSQTNLYNVGDIVYSYDIGMSYNTPMVSITEHRITSVRFDKRKGCIGFKYTMDIEMGYVMREEQIQPSIDGIKGLAILQIQDAIRNASIMTMINTGY